MSYDPSWGAVSGSKGGGGGYSQAGWGAAPAGSSAPKAPKAKTAQDPQHNLASSIVRLGQTVPHLQGSDLQRVQSAIIKQSQGLPDQEFQRVRQSVPEDMRVLLDAKHSQAMKSNDAVDQALSAGSSALGKGLNLVSAPGRAVLSGLAEYSKKYEKAGRPFIPSAKWSDTGDILNAAYQGLMNRRHDTPISISKEAGDIRKKQGVSTQAFGTLPGSPTLPWKNDLRTNPIGGGAAGNIALGVGGSIGLDPLTYASFGLSGLAKTGIEGATQSLGAEKAATLVDKGLSGLSAADNAKLAHDLAPKVFEALKGVRGGLKVKLPQLPTPSNIASGHYLGAAETVIPGPLRGLRAAKIIAGTSGRTPEVEAAAKAAEDVATEAASRAQQMHASADLAEQQGADAAHVVDLRTQANKFDEVAQQATEKAAAVRGGAAREATTVAETLRDTPLGHAGAAIAQSPAVKTLKGIFVPRAAVSAKFGEGAAKALDDARVRYQGTYGSGFEDDINALLHAAKQAKVTNNDLIHTIGPALDIGGAGKAAALPDNLRPVYDAFAKVRARITQAQIDSGVAREQAMHVTDEYFPRVMTREAQQIERPSSVLAPVAAPGPGAGNITRQTSGALRARTADLEKPVSEINKAYQAEHGVNKFEENPLTAFSQRLSGAHKDIANKQYVGDVLKITDSGGNPVMRAAGATEAIPAGAVEVKIPGVGRYFAPKEIAQEVTRSRELLTNDAALNSFKRGMDKWMTLWKGYATVPLPFGLGFHERNAMSHLVLNWEAGLEPASEYYVKAQRLQRLITKGAKQGDIYKYMTPEAAKIVKGVRQRNVLWSGFFGGDLPSAELDQKVQVGFRRASGPEKVSRLVGEKGTRLHPLQNKGALNPLNPNNAIIAPGRKLGGALQDNARLAHYLWKLDQTHSEAAAAESVRHWLFDYSDLTATEKNVFKRFKAFYTFSRKNVPVQVATLLQEPGKFSHLQAVRTSVAASAQQPKGLYPGYLPELGGIPLPTGLTKPLGLSQGVWAPDIPSTSAASDIQPVAQLLGSLPGGKRLGLPQNDTGISGAATDLINNNFEGGAPGALMAAIQAFAAKKDFFSGRNLSGRVAAPAYIPHIGPFSQDRVLNGKKQPTVTSREQYIAESLLPILGKISSVAPQGQYEQAKQPRRLLSTLTGQRAYFLDKGTTEGEALRRNALLAQIIADLKAKGIDVPTSRTSKKKVATNGWGG